MRILIVGEYSGFANNLCSGFEKLGHETFVFSWGDGFKKIEQSHKSYKVVQKEGLFGHKIPGVSQICGLIANIKLLRFVKKQKGNNKYDRALVLSPRFLRKPCEVWLPLFTLGMIKTLLKTPDNIYFSSCGGDIIYRKYRPLMRKKNDSLFRSTENYSKRDYNLYCEYSRIAKGVIPVMYDYAEGYRQLELGKKIRLLETVQLPLNLDGIEVNNIIDDKIIVFHGINQPEMKGTKIIREAMSKIERDYPEKVKCVSVGNMALKDYLNILKKANIIIDQCYLFSYAMNAIYAMAMGKVVFSGNEKECQDEYNNFDIPVINITPNPQQIYNEIKRFIEEPNMIREYSKKSREFVESFHSDVVVARKYIDIFNKK